MLFIFLVCNPFLSVSDIKYYLNLTLWSEKPHRNHHGIKMPPRMEEPSHLFHKSLIVVETSHGQLYFSSTSVLRINMFGKLRLEI